MAINYTYRHLIDGRVVLIKPSHQFTGGHSSHVPACQATLVHQYEG